MATRIHVFVLLIALTCSSAGFAVVVFNDGQTHDIDYEIADHVWVDGAGTRLNILPNGHILHGLEARGDSQIDIAGGLLDSLNLYGHSRAYLSEGAIANHLQAGEYASVTITGGSVAQVIGAQQHAHVFLGGGSAEYLHADDDGQIEVTGGLIADRAQLYDNSVIIFTGSDFNYAYGEIPDSVGLLTGTLANGDPLAIDFERYHNATMFLSPSCSIHLSYPDGGEVFNAAIDYPITWETTGQIDNVLLEFSADGGDTWAGIDTVPNTGSYTWDVPHLDSRQCLLRISDAGNAEVSDVSDGGFTILTTTSNCPGSLVGWGSDRLGYGKTDPPPGNDYVAVAAGAHHGYAIRADGSLVSWGNDAGGQVSNTPEGNDFIAIADQGSYGSIALRKDGSIVCWGDMPDAPPGNDYVFVVGAADAGIALKSDGSLVGWGKGFYETSNVPPGNDFVQVTADAYHALALKRDGTIVAWGLNNYGQCDVPAGNDFVDIACAYGDLSMAMRCDGSLISWPAASSVGPFAVPAGNDYADLISSYGANGYALKTDHSIVGWGVNFEGSLSEIPTGNNYIQIASGEYFGLALCGYPSLYYVDRAASGTNDGTSWADAFNYLQDALMLADSGDEIWVAEGVYKPDEFVLSDRPSLGRAETFQLKSGVEVYGGFPSGGGDWEDRDPNMYPTILSGDLAGDDQVPADIAKLRTEATRAENAYHVVTAIGVDETAVLDGFVLTGGNANAAEAPHYRGGGVYVERGSPTIKHCRFVANTATYGGGLYNYSHGSPIIADCEFTGNAAYVGGALADYGTARVNMCTLMGNRATNGGAFYGRSSTFSNCIVAANKATGSGGGLWTNASPVLTLCTIADNTATTGGGLYATTTGKPTLVNSILWGNSAGGSLDKTAQITGGTPVIYHSTVQGWYGSDPLFADPENGDYHLKSAAGRWDPAAGDWVIDDVSSPAIDAGNPFADVGDEPEPHGGQINQGAYGGTPEASKSLGPFNIADLNRDGAVDIRDHAIMAENWLRGVATE